MVAGFLSLALFYSWSNRSTALPAKPPPAAESRVEGWRTEEDENYFWRTLTAQHPATSIRPLPTGTPVDLPRIQADFAPESPEATRVRTERQRAVRTAFAKCWKSYHEHAWTADELTPVSGQSRNPFGGWAVTLVDALDTLWLMDMRFEFEEAVIIANHIDFTVTNLDDVNVFETAIRYLGGFLSAFDLSGDKRLLRKAAEVGEMLYRAFDTPNRMPITRWKIHAAARGDPQVALSSALVAEVGGLSMEFTRLSQLTGDPKWFDAANRVTEALADQQESTELPGMWPFVVNPETMTFNSGSAFGLGAMADSLYEYLPKMVAQMGGLLPIYRGMYEKAMAPAIEHTLFRPMTPNNSDILFAGRAHTRDGGRSIELDPQGQHLACFLGGNMVLAGKLLRRNEDFAIGRKLIDGCIWAYQAFPHGVMPESFNMVPCPSKDGCEWDAALWKKEVVRLSNQAVSTKDDDNHTDSGGSQRDADAIIAEERLPPGFTAVPDKRYILRPEAVESLFILYRVTARRSVADSAWDMFRAIQKATITELANSAVSDVTGPANELPERTDSMESFWMGETLKYLYLIFSDPGLVSLDDFVFNAEAHPFKRLR